MNRILSFPSAKAAAEYEHHAAAFEAQRGIHTYDPDHRDAAVAAQPPQPARRSVFSRLGYRGGSSSGGVSGSRGRGSSGNFPSRGNMAFLGDSIMVRLCRHKNLNVTRDSRVCRGGLTSSSLLQALKEGNFSFPENVVVCIGTNDAKQDVPALKFNKNLTALVECLQGKKVHIMEVLPSTLLSEQRVNVFNKIVNSKAGSNVNIIRIHDQFKGRDDLISRFYGGSKRQDGIHPNKQGMIIINNMLPRHSSA